MRCRTLYVAVRAAVDRVRVVRGCVLRVADLEASTYLPEGSTEWGIIPGSSLSWTGGCPWRSSGCTSSGLSCRGRSEEK